MTPCSVEDSRPSVGIVMLGLLTAVGLTAEPKGGKDCLALATGSTEEGGVLRTAGTTRSSVDSACDPADHNGLDVALSPRYSARL